MSAAVSLTNVLQEIARDYETRTGRRVILNLGPSNGLAHQIVEGAPIDVFLSADTRQMDAVERAGRLEPGTRVDLIRNQLVLAVRRDAEIGPKASRDLLQPSIRRVAIGDAAAVPAGVYARQYLEAEGLWTALQPKLVPLVSVRAALEAVAGGEADAGFVYRTDVAAAPDLIVAFEVPATSVGVVYPAAVVGNAPHPEAAGDLLRYLQDADARRRFEAAGFITMAPR